MGAHGQLTRGSVTWLIHMCDLTHSHSCIDARMAQSWNQIQTLKECLCCHIYCAHCCSPMFGTVTVSRAVSNRESRYPDTQTHVTHMYGSRQRHVWVMSHTCVRHVTHMNESWHSYEWVMGHTRMAHEWMNHSLRMYESCHKHVRVMSHTWMSHVTHMYESCHTHVWVTSHSYESCHTHVRVMSHTCKSHVTHM